MTPTGTRSDNLSLNAPYPVGITTISWNVTDNAENKAITVTQTVTVEDKEAPIIEAASEIIRDAEAGKCETTINVTPPEAKDNCNSITPAGTRSDNLALNNPFPVGTTTIYWNVSDDAGNEAETLSQTVTVLDKEKPVITDPSDISYNSDTGLCGAYLNISLPQTVDNYL